MSSDDDYNRFAADGYDAVYSIDSVEFFIAISRELQKHVELLATIISPVIYATRQEEKDSIIRLLKLGWSKERSLPPAGLMKPPTFIDQREVRAVFEPVVDYNLGKYPDGSQGMSEDQWFENTEEPSALKPINLKAPHARQFATRIS
jgi:hypothetical protein